MSRSQVLVGVDCGTSALRLACFTGSGEMLFGHRVALQTMSSGEGYSEQRPLDWWEAFVAGVQRMREAIGSDKEVRAIGVCGTTATLVPCSKQFAPLGNAIMWNDCRAAKEAAELLTALKDVQLKRKLTKTQIAPKLLWLARRRDADTHSQYLDCAAWLVAQLAQQAFQSSATIPYTKGLSVEDWRNLPTYYPEVEELLPLFEHQIVGPTESLGFVLPGSSIVSRELLGASITLTGNDGLMSACGAGILHHHMAVEVGGSSYATFLPSISPLREMPDDTFPAHPIVGGSLLGSACIADAGTRIAQFARESQLAGEAIEDVFRELSGAIQQNELLVEGEISCGANLKKVLDRSISERISEMVGNTVASKLGLHLLEVAYRADEQLANLSRIAQFVGSEVVLCGGFAANGVYRSLRSTFAAYSDRQSVLLACEDPFIACRGSAICAAVACGAFRSAEAASEAMAKGRVVIPRLAIRSV